MSTTMTEKIKKIKSILIGETSGKFYLFGASVTGEKVYKEIEKYEIENNIDTVAAFVDNNPKLQGQTFLGKNIVNKYELKECINAEDIVLITSNKYVAISNDLKELGIDECIKCDDLLIDYCYHYGEKDSEHISPNEKAVKWLLDNIIDNGGIRATSSHKYAYPEVTGYIVPTLVQYGYYNEAKNAVKWLLSLQKENGGFCGIKDTVDEDKEYIFDSGQILRGFLAFKDDTELKSDIEKAIDKVCDYLVSQMIDAGERGYILQYDDEGFAVEPILIYTLAPLKHAAYYRKNKEWEIAADNCLEYYIKHNDFLSETTLTHFLAYQIEALIELNRKDLIEQIMGYIENIFDEKGYIPGVKDAEWTCSTGDAQIAICCYLTGRNELGNKLMEQLEKMQLATGGFMGSYGNNPAYFPTTEISWANKYFLDANKLRIQEWFNDNADIFPTEISEEHAEFQAVDKIVSDGMSIAEIGCGKGRFLKLLNDRHKNLSLTGVDISQEMINCLPDYVEGAVGTLEHIPLEDEKYDIVLCIEAIEHSINVPVSVKELTRILKPNGTLIIIDKNFKHWGRLECPSWEKWFDKEKMLELVKRHCKEAVCEVIDLYHQDSDDMFLMWKGIK